MKLKPLDVLYGLGNQQISKKICVPLVIVAEKGEPTVYLVFCLDFWLLVAVAVCVGQRSTSGISFWWYSLGSTHCS